MRAGTRPMSSVRCQEMTAASTRLTSRAVRGADRQSPRSVASQRCWRCSTSRTCVHWTRTHRQPHRFGRRCSRWLTSAAVGVAAALLAVGMVIAIRPEIVGLETYTPEETAQAMDMNKVSPTPINATISLTGYGWGTRIDMACTYGDWGQRDAPPQSLGMVVVGRDGSRSQVATWLGLSGATALPSANTPMQKEEIAAVQLVSSDDGKVLLERHL